jgi:hypothetical protein
MYKTFEVQVAFSCDNAVFAVKGREIRWYVRGARSTETHYIVEWSLECALIFSRHGFMKDLKVCHMTITFTGSKWI